MMMMQMEHTTNGNQGSRRSLRPINARASFRRIFSSAKTEEHDEASLHCLEPSFAPASELMKELDQPVQKQERQCKSQHTLALQVKHLEQENNKCKSLLLVSIARTIESTNSLMFAASTEDDQDNNTLGGFVISCSPDAAAQSSSRSRSGCKNGKHTTQLPVIGRAICNTRLLSLVPPNVKYSRFGRAVASSNKQSQYRSTVTCTGSTNATISSASRRTSRTESLSGTLPLNVEVDHQASQLAKEISRKMSEQEDELDQELDLSLRESRMHNSAHFDLSIYMNPPLPCRSGTRIRPHKTI
jgi:hypothetical protein